MRDFFRKEKKKLLYYVFASSFCYCISFICIFYAFGYSDLDRNQGSKQDSIAYERRNGYAVPTRRGSLYTFQYDNNSEQNVNKNDRKNVTEDVNDAYSDDEGSKKSYVTRKTNSYEPVDPVLLRVADQPAPTSVNQYTTPVRSYEKERTNAYESGKNGAYEEEKNTYSRMQSKDENSYVNGQAKMSGKENGLGININTFIDRFLENSKFLGAPHALEDRPNRKNANNGKETSVFCMNKKRLCFTAIWNKGQDQLQSIVMVSTGDGSPRSGNEVLINVRALIASVTPDLTRNEIENLIRSMGLYNGEEIGNGFIIKPDGTYIKYEFARSAKAGLVVVAQPM